MNKITQISIIFIILAISNLNAEIEIEVYSVPFSISEFSIYNENLDSLNNIEHFRYFKIYQSYLFSKNSWKDNLIECKQCEKFNSCYIKIIIKHSENSVDTLAFGDINFKNFYYNGNYYEFNWAVFSTVLELVPRWHKEYLLTNERIYYQKVMHFYKTCCE